MSHFTYRPTDKLNLKQGDILCKNKGLTEIIREVHPHYLKDDYLYFVVLTQTCDLVRRDGKPPKTPYITLAAVRPLELLIKRFVSKYQYSTTEQICNVCDIEKKNILSQFLERLFNNNETEYFYLNEDTGNGFPVNCVVFLKLSIAIKSEIHYETCINSKILELTEEFRAKLGWLVGQMYSRVGTQDWVPDTLKKEEFDTKINNILNQNVIWIDKKLLKELKKKIIGITEIEYEDVLKFISEITIKKNIEILIDRLSEILIANNFIDIKSTTKLLTSIKNDVIIKSIINEK